MCESISKQSGWCKYTHDCHYYLEKLLVNYFRYLSGLNGIFTQSSKNLLTLFLELCTVLYADFSHLGTRIHSNNCDKSSICNGRTQLCRLSTCKLLILSYCKCLLYLSNTSIKGMMEVWVVEPKCKWQRFSHISHRHICQKQSLPFFRWYSGSSCASWQPNLCSQPHIGWKAWI